MAELPLAARRALDSATRRITRDIALPACYTALTRAERVKVREAYVEQQNGECYYCKHPLDAPPPGHIDELPIDWSHFPPGFLKHPVHLHHCHRSGLTIGATHARCNAVLAEYHNE